MFLGVVVKYCFLGFMTKTRTKKKSKIGWNIGSKYLVILMMWCGFFASTERFVSKKHAVICKESSILVFVESNGYCWHHKKIGAICYLNILKYRIVIIESNLSSLPMTGKEFLYCLYLLVMMREDDNITIIYKVIFQHMIFDSQFL